MEDPNDKHKEIRDLLNEKYLHPDYQASNPLATAQIQNYGRKLLQTLAKADPPEGSGN